MAKTLSDTQRVILTSAAVRDDLHVLPLPDSLKAPRYIVTKMVRALIEQGLIAEIAAGPDDPVSQESDDGRTTLVVTPAGIAAIGIDTEGAAANAPPRKPRTSRKGRGGNAKPVIRPKAATPAHAGPTGAKETKQAAVIALLRRQQGASIPEMMMATGWQPHSVRGFMSGALKKRLGLEVISEKDETGERRYHVAALKAAND